MTGIPKWLVVTGTLLTVGPGFAATTRMDNEFYAFKLAPAFAVKSEHGWRVPAYKLTLGMAGSSFVIDAKGLSGHIPAQCARVFSVDVSKHKPRVAKLPGATDMSAPDHQAYSILDRQGCIARIWLKPPQDYPDGAFGSVRKPATSSYVAGLLEFQAGDNKASIEFVVGANDVDAPQARTGPQERAAQGKGGSAPSDGGWDKWLESTGNKPIIAQAIPPSEVKTTGSAPAKIEVVLNACQQVVNLTGPGRPGIGAIYSIEYLSPVDASTVYGNLGPQGKLVPLKLFANFRDGKKHYFNSYLQKDPFGEFKCFSAK